MLVLTERKTCDEIVTKLKDQCAASVVEALDRLERKWSDMFKKVFRSITVDNGVEFTDYEAWKIPCLNREASAPLFSIVTHTAVGSVGAMKIIIG